ncbi:MAG: hypothetical protein AB7E81_24465 [Hyphomicrobiaceae bacterium]
MLTELPESKATGEIAKIFAEIRQFYATPYVSSVHRHLATRPGVLEWSWELASPAFRSGIAQETGWRIASASALTPLSPIPREVLAVWGVADSDVPTLRAIAESFTRVAPLNLVYGGILRDVVLGGATGGSSSLAEAKWTPPPALPEPPAMVDASKVSEAERAVLQRFLSGKGSTAFVPGLYRMLAHWPALLAHFAVELGPRFQSAEKTEAAADLLHRIDTDVAVIRASLPTPQRPAPTGEEAAHLVQMIDGYRVTSPEMILFGRLILGALPQS